MSQFRLQNYIFVPEFQSSFSKRILKYSIRRYEESFEHNSIKHVCTVKKSLKTVRQMPSCQNLRLDKNAIKSKATKKNQKRARHKEKNSPLTNDTSCISISPSADKESISSYF